MEQPPMLSDERPDTRRTGFYPPYWTPDQCRVQDARIHERELTGDHTYLHRWGALAA